MREKKPRKLDFNWNKESHDSGKSTKSKEEAETQNPIVRMSGRARKQLDRYSPPNFHSDFELSATKEEYLGAIKEVIDSMKGELWKKAMEEEMELLRKNDTWDLVVFPDGREIINSKWVFKRKTNEIGYIEKYKDQLVAKGYSQVEGVDFGEIFSPIAKLTSIRVLMSLTTTFDLEIVKIDVNTTFIHKVIQEEIYMNQPEGFIIKGKEELVCWLRRYVYGMKQSPRMWYQKFDSYIQGLGFKRS